MKQKVCVITGASEGIGKATLFKLAKHGMRLIAIGRNEAKLSSLAQYINTSFPGSFFEFVLADLAQMSQVRKAASEILSRYGRIDILINNAGAYYAERNENEEGLELTFALNHLSYFLLTLSLLPAIESSPFARIINVSSAAHRWVNLNLNDLQMQHHYSGLLAYGRSKLMNILFTYELAEKLKDSHVTVNCLHPGFVASKFGHNNQGWIGKFFQVRQELFGVDTDKGSETSTYLATSDELNHTTGLYFKRCKPIKSSSLSYSSKLAKSLFAQSNELVFG